MKGEVDTGWLERVRDDFRFVGIGFGKREEVAAIAAAIYAHRSSEAQSLQSTDGEGATDGLAPWVRVGRAQRLRRPR